jgi:ribosomal protein S18 acetylase RimI-like enzyme
MIFIREAGRRHVDAIVDQWNALMEIHRNLDADFFYATEYTDEDYKHIISETIKNKSEDKKVIIALDQEAVVGYVTIEVVRFSMLMYNFDSFCVIGDIMIAEPYRNKGLGKIFVEEAKKIAQKQNVKKLKLNVFGKNKTSYEYFKHLGFEDMMYLMTMEVE